MDKKEKIIIYGAGRRGKTFYEFIERHGKEDIIYAFCDQNYEKIKEIEGKQVISFEKACKYRLPFLISVMDEKAV